MEPDIGRRSHDDLVHLYLQSWSHIPGLGADELTRLEHELTRLRALGDSGWRTVRNRLVLHHQRLVIGWALRFRHTPVPLLDLIQEGNIGLMRAAEDFDVERGVRFSTYATWWIRRNILSAVEGQGRSVHVSSYARALERRVRRLEHERGQRCAAPLAAEETARALRVSPALVDSLRGLAEGSLSCDSVAEGRGVPLAETLADPSAVSPDAGVAECWMRRAFASGLSGIDERARRVLALRWGLGGTIPLTLEQTGRRLGITGERARQIEKAARARLRRCSALRKLLDRS